MEFKVLGPLEVRRDGNTVALAGGKPRAVLAVLLLHANEPVSVERLTGALWGEDAPASATRTVLVYVSRLRRALGDDGLVTTSRAGYRLRVRPGELDLERFERLVDDARRALAEARAEQAGSLLREALALWRGPALADVAFEPFAAAEVARLEEQRVAAVEARVEADLAAGRVAELVPELQRLVGEHPLRERLRGQLMLALYRSGRQSEALEAYRRAREMLVDEVGIEPGAELQRLHAAMLRQDDSLDAPPPPELPPELAITSPMFGREAELARLRAAWARARDGSGSVIVISGSAGSGRTRLAAELAAEVHAQRALVLYGSRGVEAAQRVARPALLVVDDADAVPPECAGVLVLCLASNGAFAPPAIERIRLGPLGDNAIADIARLHGQDSEAAALAERSGGFPGEAHRIAALWAREKAEESVKAEARRTVDELAGLRRTKSRLVGSVADLQSVRSRAERHAAGRGTVVCPYKGLASFGRADADFFFGRERLIAELVARLVGSPLVGIVGASGSGKSSLLRAGLLAELDKGVLPGSDAWTQVVIRPGEHPPTTLRQATAGAEPGTRLLIAVDQFEETFTLCRDAAERAEFLRDLVAAATQPAQDAAVVLAVRADFYGRCAEHPALASLLGDNQLLVGAMRRDELRRAIEMPAERAGLEVDPELVDVLLADTADEPGALPLLSTALLELWQQRDGRRLRLAAYERTGGVRGAVARLAERAYERLDPDQRRVARHVFLRLGGDDGDGVRVRRRVPLEELEADRVLDLLADSRLVTVSEGTAEVAHEALLREWPRLRGWLEEDAEGRRLHAQLMHAAREWNRDDRDRGELYRGARLASALEWRAEHEPELNTNEQRFLDASRVASERARRRIQLALAGVTALLIVAAVGALVALDQRGRAREQARAAEAQRLGAQALNTDTVDRSVLLARQGVSLDRGLETQANLLAALRRSPAVVGAMRPGISGLLGVEQVPSTDTLVVSDLNGALALVDPAAHRRLGVHRPAAGTVGVGMAVAPDGSLAASSGIDAVSAFVDLFDTRTRHYVGEVREGLSDTVPESMLFSPDSNELLVQSAPDRISRWDVRGAPRRVEERLMPGKRSRLLGFEGSRLVTYSAAERAIAIRDPATLRAERLIPVPSGATGLEASSGIVALSVGDGSLRLLDLESGRMRTAEGRHTAPVTALAVGPDGRTVVTAGGDHRLIVWDARRATAIETLETGAAGAIADLTVTPDARTAYSAGRDGTLLSWDLEGRRRFERPLRVAGGRLVAGRALVASGRGRRFAAIDRQGTVEVFESGSLARVGRIRLGRGRRALAAAVSPDRRTLAVTDLGGRVQWWDLRTLKPLGEPVLAHAYGVTSVAYSSDGRWMVTGGFDPIVHLWDARRRTPRNTLNIRAAADLSLNPQGTLLAVTHADRTFAGGLELVSVPELEVVRHVRAPIGTVGRFTPDGRSLVYGDRDGRVWIYDTRTWRPRGGPISLTTPIRTADISPDGRTLATTAVDNTVALWDLASHRAIGSDPPRAAGELVGAGFIDGGRQLAVLHDRGGFAWDLRPGTWERHACAVAGRTLTRAEWDEVLPDRPYAPACR